MSTPKRTQQELAKDLYLQTEKTQQEIADILNVSRRTVYLWIKNGRWAEMKAAARQAPGIIMQDITNHITAINDRIRDREGDGCPTMQEVEMLRKLVGMTKVIEKQTCGSYIQAFQELTMFITQKDVLLGRQVMKHADTYVKGTFGDSFFHVRKEMKENLGDVKNNLKSDTEYEDPTPAIDINFPRVNCDNISLSPGDARPDQSGSRDEVASDNTSFPGEPVEGGEGNGEALPDNTSLSPGEGRGEAIPHNSFFLGACPDHFGKLVEPLSNDEPLSNNEPGANRSVMVSLSNHEQAGPADGEPKVSPSNHEPLSAHKPGEPVSGEALPDNISLSFGEGRGEVNAIQCDTNAITPPPTSGKDNTLNTNQQNENNDQEKPLQPPKENVSKMRYWDKCLKRFVDQKQPPKQTPPDPNKPE